MSNGTVERSFFGAGTRIEGTLEVEGDVKLEGEFRGKIIGTATVTVGEKANLQANLSAPTIIVQGLVRGEIHAQDRLELARSARVNGVLRSPRIRIDEGAVFEGECRMSASEAPKPAQTPKIEPTRTIQPPLASPGSPPPPNGPFAAENQPKA